MSPVGLCALGCGSSAERERGGDGVEGGGGDGDADHPLSQLSILLRWWTFMAHVGRGRSSHPTLLLTGR